jgi:Flavin containing amine oxidoreductase
VRVAVVGAGFAGLACAADLAGAGIDVTVFEASDRVGGRVWSDVMPDGARFERGGEFVEAGYDHLRRRAAAFGLPLAAQGFEFGSREVRADGRGQPDLLRQAEQVIAQTTSELGNEAARISAADALAQAPLEPLARLALTRRLEGTYTVELERVSAAWLASVELRAADVGEVASARLAGGNDALARALAAELPGRLRLGCAIPELRSGDDAVVLRANGLDERFDRAVLAVPLPLALALLPELRERAAYARLSFGVASKLHVPLAEPMDPGAVQGLEAAFWTWAASGAAGGPATVASASRAAPAPTPSSNWRTAAIAGSRRCRCSGPSSDRWVRRCSRAGRTSSTAAARTRAILPAGRRPTMRRSLHRMAACISPASTPRPSSAARSRAHCAAVPAPPPRCSPIATAQQICIDQCLICDLHW